MPHPQITLYSKKQLEQQFFSPRPLADGHFPLETTMGPLLVHDVVFLWGSLLSYMRLSWTREIVLNIPEGMEQTMRLLVSELDAL